MRKRHPVAGVGWPDLATEARLKFGSARVVVEEDTEAAGLIQAEFIRTELIPFDNAGASGFPKARRSSNLCLPARTRGRLRTYLEAYRPPLGRPL